MRSILILGAGRSASALIRYLIDHADQQEWRVSVADRDVEQAKALIPRGSEVAAAVALDAANAEQRAAHPKIVAWLKNPETR